MDELLPDQDGDGDRHQQKDPPPPPPGYDTWKDVSLDATCVVLANGLVVHDAKDAAQETVVMLIKSYWDGKARKWKINEASAKPLVGTIAYTRAMNVHRSIKRRRKVAGSKRFRKIVGDGAPDISDSDETLTVDEAIKGAGLSHAEEAVVRGRLDDLHYKDLATDLKRTEGSIRGLVNRAHRKLRGVLKQQQSEGCKMAPGSDLKLSANTDDRSRTYN